MFPSHDRQEVFYKKIKKAILTDIVDKSVFDVCESVELVKMEDILNGSTSAGSAPAIASKRGHKHITFYGCDSSYRTQTHIYKNDKVKLIKVECGGESFLSCPQMIQQAEYLSEIIRALPNNLKVKGESFLKSLVKHGDYDVTHVCKEIDQALKEAS
jgi:hypothetical protein